jgi:hypothetical protein
VSLLKLCVNLLDGLKPNANDAAIRASGTSPASLLATPGIVETRLWT